MLLEDSQDAIHKARVGRRRRQYRIQVAGVLAVGFTLSLQMRQCVQQPCSNPSKSPETLRKAPMSKYDYLQRFCKRQKPLAM